MDIGRRSSAASVAGVEIERKFLVSDPPLGDARRIEEIEQGYLAAGKGEVRLRRRDGRLLLTAKGGEGLSREEAEIELSPEQFDRLWPLTEGRRIRKRRHRIPHGGGLEIELDVYEDDLAGLVVAEVEFGSEQEAHQFEPPGWLGADVTGENAYMNRTLASDGAPR